MRPSFGVRRLRITGLFGLYDYTLPKTAHFQNIVIFYGDNGSGKTTLLQLLFHLLSAADKRSHRSALLKVPFRSLVVDLADGTELGATRPGEIDASPLILTIKRNGTLISRWDFFGETPRERDSPADPRYRMLQRQLQ